MVNASSVTPAMQRFTISSISGIIGAATLLFIPTSRFTPTSLTLELTSVSGFISVATLSLGTNGASYNNIIAAAVMTGVVAANNLLTFPISALVSSVEAGTGVYINVTGVAISTTYVIKATITGFYD